jgi:O-methyltransferase involved in polyketide biosynthesis
VSTSGKGAAGLGDVQQTLFVTLTARAAETRRRRPALRDPKAVEIAESVEIGPAYAANWGGFTTVTRTLIFDGWVREFLREHPAGTVVELGTGLNTRFERLDNGACHWIDLDLPDTIEVRRRFFADTGRRRMVAASLLDAGWHDVVAASPGPYFFVCEGVLVYLDEGSVTGSLRQTARRFPSSSVAFDTYGRRLLEQQHKTATERNMAARWAWSCDDPGSLGASAGLELLASLPVTRPPAAVRRALPLRYRALLRLADTVLHRAFTLNLFRATP